MKKIYHVHGGTFRNYGDMALVYAMQTELSRASKIPLQFIDIDLKHPDPITSDMVDMINKDGDALIVGGGGLVMSGDGFETRSGWQFNISLQDLHDLTLPLIIYGAGYNLFPGDELSAKAITHLQVTQQVSTMFSCRDKKSSDALEALGLYPTIEVIADPAMMTPHVSVDLPGIESGQYLIGVSLAGDRLEKRFKKPEDWNYFVERMSYELRNLCEFFGGKVVFIPHINDYDLEPEKFFRDQIPEEQFYSLKEHMPHLYPEKFFYVPVLAGIYKRMNLVIGMRGHSLIIPYGLGTPIIGIGTHDKIGFFCESVGAIVCDPMLKKLHGAILSSRTKDPNQMQQVMDLTHYKNTTNDFNRRILEMIGAR